MSFTHLHVHTEFSLLDGSSKIKEITARAAELGMDSLAITDHGVMYGVIDFYRAAKNAGIKPIIGCEVYVAPGSRFDKEAGQSEDRYYHLILLAENQKGYQNLIKIVSKGFVDGFYYKPRVDMEVLREFSEGIICLSACLAGEVQRLIVRGMYDEAKKSALKYEEIFGKGNYFLELQDHGIPEQKMVNQQLMRMSVETGIELVCTNDVHYTYADDATAHDILLCIQTGKKKDDADRMRYEGGQYYLKSEAEMADLFKYAPQALENTHKIAERCNVEFEFGKYKLPKYDVPEGYTAWEYLNELCRQGLKKRYPDSYTDESIVKRLEYELNTINTMGFVDYFLIVWDFINYAKSNDIMVGPGRGSAAGSIVSYSLGITDIDPLKYNLLFERFLNPDRVSMPDIDIDFCVERRQEVIDYVARKYGRDHVAQIVTFGTLQPRGVIRDVARVLDMPYAKADLIAKMIPQTLHITLNQAMEENADLKKLYEEDAEVRYLIDMAKRLEGLPRHASMHAAGVVICGKPVDEYVPLSRASDGSITTQFIMTTLEELGLLKMDFLGLRNLTVIQKAIGLIKENKDIEIDLNKIDYNDKGVLALIGAGKTEGIFQLESGGMKSFMTELKPQSLEDIIAGISLYRPGPMDFIPKYLAGKNNPSEITYDCPMLEPILKPTYGCIVYQEQVMQIVRDLGGFTLGRSDSLRRAMSKKKLDVMQKERQTFVYGNEDGSVKGCINNGIDESTANKIYDDMIDFAKYAFNKSHAAAYAVVAFQTAYLKKYYPTEFMAAMLTSVMDRTDKIAEYIYSCRSMGIDVLVPDINESTSGFSAVGNSIRYGLNAIKSIGKNVCDAIAEERVANGKYQSIHDFIERVADKGVNRRALENLIKAGALDSLEGTRRQFMIVYIQILEQVNSERKNSLEGQMSLFDFADKEEANQYKVVLPNIEDFSLEEKLTMEKEVLGLYVSGHPLNDQEQKWRSHITNLSVEFTVPDREDDSSETDDSENRIKDKQNVTVGGIVTGLSVKYTKQGNAMAVFTLEDLVGTVEVVVFPKEYSKYSQVLTEDAKVFVSGQAKISENTQGQVVTKSIVSFDDVNSKLWIQFENIDKYNEMDEKLFDYIMNHQGKDQPIIYLKEERAKKPLNIRIDASAGNIKELEEIFGKENVRLT